MEIQYTSRPGVNDKIASKKEESAQTIYFKLEEERFKFFIE